MSSAVPRATLDALRRSFLGAGYTVGGIRDLLGDEASRALARNETTPASRRTRDGSALSTLIRLWPLQAAVSRRSADAAIPDLVDPLRAAGVLETSGEEVRALVDISPYADDARDWWLVSDLTQGLDGRSGRNRPDHVLGASASSTTLAELTVREPVERALDLGTGSGIQSLHLSTHVGEVVATDVNPRCLRLAAFTAGLNQVDLDLRLGSLYEPVRDGSFGLVVANLPFVVSPGTGQRLVYRDSGLPGDEIVRRVVTESVAHLDHGGWCQVIANWVHRSGEGWSERVGGWLEQTGCDAWAVQREVTDAAQYVEMWLSDAGLRDAPDYVARYDDWLAWFDAEGIEAVGFGWITLRNAGREHADITVEDWPYEIAQPLGPHVRAWGEVTDRLDGFGDEALLATRLVRAPDLVEERIGTPGEEHPSRIILRGQRGMRRSRQVTTAVAAMVGACDGDLTLDQIAFALSSLLSTDLGKTRVELLAAARDLVRAEFVSCA
jgi:methylase of polypeptide subunit release factors